MEALAQSWTFHYQMSISSWRNRVHSVHVCEEFLFLCVCVCVCVTCYMLHVHQNVIIWKTEVSDVFHSSSVSYYDCCHFYVVISASKSLSSILCTIAIFPRLAHLRLNNRSLFIGSIMDEIPTINHMFWITITPWISNTFFHLRYVRVQMVVQWYFADIW